MTRNLQQTRRKAAIFAAGILFSVSVSAQTRVEPPKNKYKPSEDVQLGQQAAAEVRRELPMLNDGETEEFVRRIGQRLIGQIPSNLRQPAFRYSFEVVNLKDINAFALPGGPMFLHRGMIEAANSDGEVAGVMAHELSHVILRHGTAQATKGQKFQIGSVLGQIAGAIIGGTKGAILAQGTDAALGTYFLKYGRDYERQADLLGAQLMARAGYNPRDMARMFETIARQGGNRGPEWLSSHPDPGNRSAAIIKEAESLRVADASTSPQEFQSVKGRLARMSPAPTAQQVAQQRQGQRAPQPAATGGRGMRVEPPSSQWQTYQPGQFLRISVPSNWREIGGEGAVTYAPEGGYVQAGNGRTALTHGLEVGVARGDGSTNLQQATEQLLQGFAQSNPQLRRQGGYSRTSVGGREGLTTTLTNVSEVTGETEAVNVSTARLRDGSLLFIIGVAPVEEANAYMNTFSRVRQAIKISDR
jgi:hypothetical protein